MKKLLILILVGLLLSGNAWAALAIDGSATSSGATTVSLTTADTNDIIVLLVHVTDPTSASAVTGVSGGSLTWNKRTAYAWTSTVTINNDMEIWWAYAASPLSSTTITVSFSGPSPINMRLVAFGVNGANTTTPFDTNVSLPSSQNTALQTATATISTTNANTLLFGFLRCEVNGFGTVTRPSGFTQLIATGGFAEISTNIVSSTQSSVGETYSWTTATTSTGYLFDAVQQASAGGTPTNAIMGTF